mgnify:CR=1 FL=1
MELRQAVKIKKEFRRDKFDADIGFVYELNSLDGSYTKVKYSDGDSYIKTDWLVKVSF